MLHLLDLAVTSLWPLQESYEQQRPTRPTPQQLQPPAQAWPLPTDAAAAALQAATLQGLAGTAAAAPPSAQLQQHQATLQQRAADEFLWHSQQWQMQVTQGPQRAVSMCQNSDNDQLLGLQGLIASGTQASADG